jgi:hypothetical protein
MRALIGVAMLTSELLPKLEQSGVIVEHNAQHVA